MNTKQDLNAGKTSENTANIWKKKHCINSDIVLNKVMYMSSIQLYHMAHCLYAFDVAAQSGVCEQYTIIYQITYCSYHVYETECKNGKFET